MNEYFGHERPWRQFASAIATGKIHHGWILAGPRGLGKAGFALRAAAALVDPKGEYRNLIARGSHPDVLTITRLPKESAKEGEDADSSNELRRSITIDQIRKLQSALNTRPGLAEKRAIIIDSADDLERSGANALLKSLEEPPVGTYFLLVSHASDRLLPTIRSRCQMLRFEPLDSIHMASAVRAAAPDASDDDIETLVRTGRGLPGQALDFLGLDMGKLEDTMTSIIRSGDRTNVLRSGLAEQLALKAAQPRYEAFLRRVPALIAERARGNDASDALAAVEAWRAASSLANRAVSLSLDKQSVVLEMSSLLASLQPHKAA